MKIAIRRGLPVVLSGAPVQEIGEAPAPAIALLADDHRSMRAEVVVEEGDAVLAGSPLWRDKARPDIVICSPVAGKVVEVSRGPRRQLGRVVVEGQGTESRTFEDGAPRDRQALKALLCDAGLWPALRERPFERIPDPATVPDAIFVPLIDTRPHAARPAVVTAGREDDLAAGLALLPMLTDGPVFLCHDGAAPRLGAIERLTLVAVEGGHPAGLVGSHIARLFPLVAGRRVWHIGYQDVMALGHLVRTGTLDGRRVIALSGPALRNPRLVRTAQGADLHALMRADLAPGPKRILSGAAIGGTECQYLRRHDFQATALKGPRQGPRNWLVEALVRAARPAPLIPTQALEQALGVCDHPVPMLRALSVGDAATARRLGCLQLAEEDLALATYATGGAPAFEPMLRQVLDMLAEER